MKKILLLLVFLSAVHLIGQAQSGIVPPPVPVKGSSHAASLHLHLPVGVFARSHVAGAGINYAWSRNRFGRSVPVAGLIGFTANAGADYYLGKKITTAGYDFTYGGYANLYVQAGALINHLPTAYFSLTAGPAMDLYEGNTTVGLGINLYGAYYLTSNIAVGPGLLYKKDAQTDALWTATIRVSYIF